MPLIDSIEGIKIAIYNGEHRPPNIHALLVFYELNPQLR